ncbi:MAG: hypothetical protein V1816_01530 [Pseudomonadota bacterium]
MITFNELKHDRRLLSQIDWDLTPQEAFEAYQIKSPQSWKHRALKEACFFQVSVYQGASRVVLVKKTYKDSEEIAEAPAPEELVHACLSQAPGGTTPHGAYPLDQGLRDWLQKELNI